MSPKKMSTLEDSSRILLDVKKIPINYHVIVILLLWKR